MKKIISYLSLILLLAATCKYAQAQLSIDELDLEFTIDFNTSINGVNNSVFSGDGFVFDPSEGQLDANAWAVFGAQEGDKDFGEEADSGVFAMGKSDGDVDDAGIYAFEVESNNFALGFKATDIDFGGSDAGSIRLEMINNSGTDALGYTISYDLWIRNSQDRSTKVSGKVGRPFFGVIAWFDAPDELIVITDEQADASPAWTKQTVSYVGQLPISNDRKMYFKWLFEDYQGTGDRDEIAIDNFTITMHENAPCVTIKLNASNNIFTENFDEDSYYLHCWTQDKIIGNREWTYQQGAGSGSINDAVQGERNARFTAFPGGPYRTKLVSPTLDLTEIDNPILRFWYGQEEHAGNQNTLAVYFRISPTDPWQEITSYNNATNQWTLENALDLPNPSATYQIAFEGIDNNARPNVIDNVSIMPLSELPAINVIDLHSEVQNIHVCIGTTDVNVPMQELVDIITVTDTNDNEYQVVLTWSVPDYDGNTSGTYTATGTFEMPYGVNQTSPPTPLQIETDIIVNDLPQLNCQTQTITSPGTIDLADAAWVTPTGGTYTFSGNVITSFTPEDFYNGEYDFEYTYTHPVTECTNSCEFSVIVQMPAVLNEIDVFNETTDATTCRGTAASVAVQGFNDSISISDNLGGIHRVKLNWVIQAYNPHVPGEYAAFGQFTLPSGIQQSDPPQQLFVEAKLTVFNLPSLSCPGDFTVLVGDPTFVLSGAEPEGGVYVINGVVFETFNPGTMGIGNYNVEYQYTDPVTDCYGTCSFVITVDFFSDINNNEFNNKFSLYPNPNEGEFYVKVIKSGVYDLKIYDLNGKIVKANTINSDDDKYKVSLNEKSGIYILQIIGQEHTYTKKIIVK